MKKKRKARKTEVRKPPSLLCELTGRPEARMLARQGQGSRTVQGMSFALSCNQEYFAMNDNTEARSLRVIAAEIISDWSPVHVHARPYVSAMLHLDKIDDRYGMDDADEIILRFLTNAGRWKGETARRIKRELNRMSRAHHRTSKERVGHYPRTEEKVR